MSFVHIKSDTGAVPPWEYKPADAGTYQVGQLLGVTDGVLTALAVFDETPPYLCMREDTIEAGTILPVTRVSDDYVYETTLADGSEPEIGDKLQITADGLQAEEGDGTFEVVLIDGDRVHGRWV